ncbi:hypothetical protein H6F74_08710 [Trichocoleus sp. FACHB-90]|uniref:hypothetical protein n=1 Tax=Cyanophyceae TaxID=3028117 RepID=UPI001683F4E1|nr:hypothetical protein [Trichocoleus sp. FACHB-90]MBD1926327.1 hypothetical protein [Trichocoleus sp. FACHB-90]
MRKVKIVMAQSGVIDQVLTPPEVIVESAKQRNQEYIPLTIGHDIRKPPIGRVISAEVVVLDDGTHLLEGEAEIFDGSANFDLPSENGKCVKIRVQEVDKFQVLGNQTFEEDEDVADLYQELRALGGGDPDQVYREDSVDPISLLIIGFGVFTLQGIANGFFSKLGEDLYEKLKLKLKKIFEKKSLKQKENLLQFQIFVKSHTGRTIEVNVVITNPSQNDLSGFFDFVPSMLDTMLSSLPIDDLDVCRVVFSYEFTQLKLLYILRSDGVPIKKDDC